MASNKIAAHRLLDVRHCVYISASREASYSIFRRYGGPVTVYEQKKAFEYQFDDIRLLKEVLRDSMWRRTLLGGLHDDD